jgi:hypothetical protein
MLGTLWNPHDRMTDWPQIGNPFMKCRQPFSWSINRSPSIKQEGESSCLEAAATTHCIMPSLIHSTLPQPIYLKYNTERFIMFSVITNIYNKKTEGPTLMELFTATGKLKKLLLTTRYVRCVHHGWHGTHWYDIQVLATHASTWVHRYSLLLQWSVPLGQRVHVAMVGRTQYTVHSASHH